MNQIQIQIEPAKKMGKDLRTWNENTVVVGNTFLNGTETDDFALTVNGPCGRGGAQFPINGNMYSPPTEDETVKVALESPKTTGSKCTSNTTSVPDPDEAGADVSNLSQVYSGLSI